jgi:hypothetical protein
MKSWVELKACQVRSQRPENLLAPKRVITATVAGQGQLPNRLCDPAQHVGTPQSQSHRGIQDSSAQSRHSFILAVLKESTFNPFGFNTDQFIVAIAAQQ